MKEFFRHYFAEMKPSRIWWKLRHGKSLSFVFYVILFYAYSMFNTSLINREMENSSFITDLSITLPFLIVWFLSAMHPLNETKMFYLCPMDKITRRRKIRNYFIGRSLVNLFIFLVGDITFAVCANVSLLDILALIVSSTIVSFSITNLGEWDEGTGYCIAFYLVQIIMVVIGLGEALSSKTWEISWISCFFLVALVIEIPLFIKYIKAADHKLTRLSQFEGGCYEPKN